MRLLTKLAEIIALYVLQRAKTDSNVTAKEYEQWKREYKQDFGRDFK